MVGLELPVAPAPIASNSHCIYNVQLSLRVKLRPGQSLVACMAHAIISKVTVRSKE